MKRVDSWLARPAAVAAAIAFSLLANAGAATLVPTTIQRTDPQTFSLRFETRAGVKYRVVSGTNLNELQQTVSILDGTGLPQSVPVTRSSERMLFFRTEEVAITPITNMIWIPPGAFQMGSPLTEAGRDLDEDPLTQVILPTGFWMGKYEVTQLEYQAAMGVNPSFFDSDPELPVESVTWNEAIDYCSRLTTRERTAGRIPPGFAYRLPTEAEFEYTLRAGTTTRFFFGDDTNLTLVGNYAWHGGNSGDTTHRVGQKLPNAFGLYDIAGNVWEWCMDWYFDYYPGGIVTNPSGPASGFGRVLRGGSYSGTANSAVFCRSAMRNYAFSPSYARSYVGFRVVLAPSL